ncbi:MAG: alpha-amylase [Candidatus Scalindua sp. AMX11]|nr:MAG: alpha-amylase [Candidatus Scalindua sp.]RZV82485.1 MAG: alpha-amylase [Candidatus Scalindua sp. SCAELEC01]TDE65673.1 MAG: alpha-amylase [Candidatus Scalindua sp. AMX11]
MVIYNLFPLLAGKVSEWESHLGRAAEMGFNWVFVNPIHLTGSSGSLYSIKDYFQINPILVDPDSAKSPDAQVKEVNKAAEELGLRMMVDLVINHCAVDSVLLSEHPEWFHWDQEGHVGKPFCYENGKKVVWEDLAKFDYWHTRDQEGLFLYFCKALKFLIDLGFRGFRCDAAYQIPESFWERLIREARSLHPDVHFFAETLGCTPEQTKNTAGAGFDYIFNSSKWWDFHNSWLMEQYNLTRDVVPSVSFPESHDTCRLADEFQGNTNGLKQRYLFSALYSAGVLVPIGFEFGFRKRLHVVKTRSVDWEDTDVDLTSFITKVNKIKESYGIFQIEAPTDFIDYHNPNILIMWKGSQDVPGESLIILNKDIHNKQRFDTDSLRGFIRSGGELGDVSPEYPLDYLPEPFSYDLRPGQGIVLVTENI